NVPHVQVQAILLSSQRCLITVRDNGIGFQEKFLPHIFKPFERLNREQDYPGNGMGLAICARIADRHHGELRAESNLGEGSAFYVEL
ncbi:ATP-binding protein, partial [Salmonella enterica]|uniref:ATP-binding protein n=1 Tax=Salmonella enterica TaxID=28901 RepID=UPI003D28D74A